MSDPKDSRLDRATHDRIYMEQVLPDSDFYETTPRARPKAVITAGQPGAGKGNVVDAVRAEFSENVVVIDPDELRRFHRNIKHLRETYPYTWSSHTQQDAGQWATRLRSDVIAGQRNVILDTTLANADPAVKQIRELQANGYEVEVRAVAAHKLESELGVDKRFTDGLMRKGHGRHVPADFRDFAYDALPASLDKVHEQTGARVRIYNREGTNLYDSRTSPLKPSVALEQSREARMQDTTVTRDTARVWRDQQDLHRTLPETLQRHPRIGPTPTAQNLPPEHRALGIEQNAEIQGSKAGVIDDTVRVEPAARAAKLGLKVAADAAVAVDAYRTGRETARLLDQDNLTGAQSHVLHFGGRNAGMVAGAVTGARIGAALGVESGPALFATGAIGGVAGAVLGDRAMDLVDQARIHNQQGSDGHTWQSDPRHPERGWTRHAPAYGTNAQGRATYEMQTLRADARSSSELDYKASNTAVELALAYAPNPKNPFSQPPEAIGEQVLAGIGANDSWTRDPQSRTWTRQAIEPATPTTHGMPVQRTVTANPEQSRQLDAAARATIAENITHSRQGIAQQYQSTYDERGWKQHGPVPAAVLDAKQASLTQQRASDGHDYTQGQDGQWSTAGTVYGTNAAQGHVRAQLDATKQQVQQASTTAPAPSARPARTPQQIEAALAPRTPSPPPAPLPAGRMSFAEAHKRRGEPEQTSPGSLRSVGRLDPTGVDKSSGLFRTEQAQALSLVRDLDMITAIDAEKFRNEPRLERLRDRTEQRTQQPMLDEALVQARDAPARAASTPAVDAPAPTQGQRAVPLSALAATRIEADSPAISAPLPSTSMTESKQPAQPGTFPAPQPENTMVPLRTTAAAEVQPDIEHSPAAAPVPSQPAAVSSGPVNAELAAAHARVAEIEAQIARLTAQQGQAGPTWRDGTDERQPGPAALPFRPTEPVAPTRAADPRDPRHPDHEGYQRILDTVTQSGRWDAQQSANIASRALAAFKAEPLSRRMDLVSMEPHANGTLRLFVGTELKRGQPACLSMAMVDPEQAARVPVEQSFERLAQINQQRTQHETQWQAQQQANIHPLHSRHPLHTSTPPA